MLNLKSLTLLCYKLSNLRLNSYSPLKNSKVFLRNVFLNDSVIPQTSQCVLIQTKMAEIALDNTIPWNILAVCHCPKRPKHMTG